MGSKKDRRRRLIVDSPLQGRIVISISWPIVACIAVTTTLLLWFTEKVATQAVETGVALPGLTSMLATVLAFIGCSIAYLVWHVVKLSHRVVGPMRRIQHTLERFRSGDPSVRIQVREGDFLHETAGHVNTFLDWVEARTDEDPAGGPQGRIPDAREAAPTEAPAEARAR